MSRGKKSGKKNEYSQMHNRRSAKRIALLGMFTTVALIFSYMETLIPIDAAIPGIKLGLANIVTIIVLTQMGISDAVLVSIARICLTTLLFGNLSLMIYSFAGAALSIFIMKIIHKTKLFGVTGVSICGGIAHNIGQLITAAMMMENQNIMLYTPILLISGTITGVITGLAAALISKSVKLSG